MNYPPFCQITKHLTYHLTLLPLTYLPNVKSYVGSYVTSYVTCLLGVMLGVEEIALKSSIMAEYFQIMAAYLAILGPYSRTRTE